MVELGKVRKNKYPSKLTTKIKTVEYNLTLDTKSYTQELYTLDINHINH